MLRPACVLIAAAAVALSLTACSGNPAESTTPSPSVTASPTQSASPTVSPSPTPTPIPVSNSLESIKVSGKFGEAPKVEMKAPFAIDQTRFQVEIPGTGPKAAETGLVTVHYHGINARTGKVFEESFTKKTPATFPLNGVIAGFKKGLTNQNTGSRMLIAIPGEDGYDAAPTSGPAGYQKGDTLIFVVDILSVSVTEASGKVVPAPAGLPSVTGTGAEKPVVTIPAEAPPTSMAAHSLIEGTGAKVAANSTIYVRYVGYSWKTKRDFIDKWDTPETGALSETIPGWKKGLEGKTVGSRVMLVLPPADGYPEGSHNPPVEKGDTIVYVIDILHAY